MADEIQVTIVLDSGLFLTDEEANGFTYSEVGYFTPHLHVYRDGEKTEEIDPAKMGTNCRLINVRKTGGDVKESGGGIKFSKCLLKHLLRLHKVYGHFVIVDRPQLDCIFNFNSGSFRSSKVKPRAFKECDGQSHQLTGKRLSLDPIAHDITVEFGLAEGEKLTLSDDAGTIIWSSDSLPTKGRIDIEIMADNSTAVMFYRDALKLRGQNYWLPNQDDPPPTWVHGGHGGGGG